MFGRLSAAEDTESVLNKWIEIKYMDRKKFDNKTIDSSEALVVERKSGLRYHTENQDKI